MDKSTFSDRLKYLRSEKGYTQENLALIMNNRYGIGTTASVKNWERKGNNALPEADYLIALCDILECDADYLLCRQKEPRKTFEIIADETGLEYETVKKIGEYTPMQKAVLSDLINNGNIFSEFLSGLQKCTEIAFRNFALRRNQINKRERYQINTINDLSKIDYHLTLKECENTFENHGYITELFHVLLNTRIIESKKPAVNLFEKSESKT